jgi:hypothetical protein
LNFLDSLELLDFLEFLEFHDDERDISISWMYSLNCFIFWIPRFPWIPA